MSRGGCYWQRGQRYGSSLPCMGRQHMDDRTYIGPRATSKRTRTLDMMHTYRWYNTIACHAIVAGHVTMWMYSGLGLAAVTHQGAWIEPGAFIGASAFFKGEAKLFTIYAGVPAKPIGPNVRLARALRDQGLGILVPDWLCELLDQSPTGSDPSSHPQHTPPEPPDVPPCDPSL
jgi:hypothetical protein